MIIFAKLLISNFQNNKGVTEQNFTKYCAFSKYFTQNELIELVEKNNHDIINNNDYKYLKLNFLIVKMIMILVYHYYY